MRLSLFCVFLLIAVAAMFGYAYCQEAPPPSVRELAVGAVSAELPLPLRHYPYTPVIDAGHGGIDTGAVSVSGAAESAINLAISQKTELLLRFCGIKTVMTRESDISLHDPDVNGIAKQKRSDLQNRVARINGISNAVLISIHQNKFPQQRYYGAQCFYNGSEQGKLFAERMQERLRLTLDPENHRQAKKPDADIYLLTHVKVPAVLVECGFLSNPREEALLRDETYQRKIALGICGGFFDYLQAESE